MALQKQSVITEGKAEGGDVHVPRRTVEATRVVSDEN
jgi:hypothetical protein